jgi:hypothetical protein
MAFGTGTIGSIGGAVQDIFASSAHETKAKGLRIEVDNYDRSAGFADQNARFTEVSTEIRQAQLDRDIFKTIGGQSADGAGAGFAASGSALDLMRDSASQGALMKAVGEQQGLVTEEGYKVQSANFTAMGQAARMAADAEDDAATGALWSSGFKAAAAVTSIFLK